MNPKYKRILIAAGYPVFALMTFLLFTTWRFPYDKVRIWAEDYLSNSSAYDVKIADLGSSFFLGVSAREIAISERIDGDSRSAGGDNGEAAEKTGISSEKKSRPIFTIDEATFNAGFFSLLIGRLAIDFDIEGAGGVISGGMNESGKNESGSSGWDFDLEVEEVDLGPIGKLQSAVPPLAGKLSGRVEVSSASGFLSELNGKVALQCKACALGDGVKKLAVPGNPMLAMGITLPKVDLGDINGKITVERGVAKIDELVARSKDIELISEGFFMLRNRAELSRVQAYIRFKISPELKRRDAKFEILESSFAAGLRSDGFSGIRITGSFMNPQAMPSRDSFAATGPAGH